MTPGSTDAPASLATTDLSDAHESTGQLQYPTPILRHFGGVQSFHGPIATVRVFEDNVRFVETLETVEPGTVVVLDGAGSMRCALMGDRVAARAVERGVAGVVINGCVRDSAELAELPLGILALAAHPKRSAKQGVGERDVPVVFADVVWTPGHYLYADADGVVLAPHPLH